MSTEDFVNVLQQWAEAGPLNHASLNEEGTELIKDGQSLPATTKVTIAYGDKVCEYTLASIFLQIVDPAQGLKDYRAACKKYKVKDPVKASDKLTVVGFFLGAQADESAAPEAVPPPVEAAALPIVAPEEISEKPKEKDRRRPPSSAPPDKHRKERDKNKEREKDKDKEKDRHHRHEKKRSHSSSRIEERKKKSPKTINTETLFSNLVTVVDKRSNAARQQKKEETAQLTAALSTEGFEVTPDLLLKYKQKTEAIVANEIPVGNSASILKAAADKDLSRILKMYLEVMQPKANGSKASSTATLGQKKTWRAHLVGQKPVIIVPKGMTAPITLLNAHEFFGNSRFVPRDVMMKKGFHKTNIPSTFSRRVGQRLGGGMVTYEIMDNPKVKLPTAKDWDRVVSVVCLGQGWQFKDWPGHYSDPVRLFSSVFGFYAGMEGAKLPKELESWAVTQAKLNRDKRGLDSVTYASFWNGVDEFMAINKPEMLPQPETS